MATPVENMILGSIGFLIDYIGFERVDALRSLGEYIDFVDDLLPQMEEAIAAEDHNRIIDIVHSIKGSAGNTRFDLLVEASNQLGKAAKNQDLEECKEAYWNINRLVKEMKTFFTNTYREGEKT